MMTLKLGNQKDIDGSDLVRLIARAQDRESKLARNPQEVAPKQKASIGNKIAGWFLASIGLYIAIHVIVALVRR
jgi:hypothetical protein